MRKFPSVVLLAVVLGACQAPLSSSYAREQPARRDAEVCRLQETVRAPSPVRHAPTRGDALTVEECIADALRRNPTLDAALFRWNASAARVDVVTEYPDAVARFVYMPEPIETRLGPTHARFGIMQKIPWPGKLDARGRVQAARAEVDRLDLRRLAWRIATDVRLGYADLVDVDRDTQLVEVEIALLESWREIVTARLELGQARISDSVQIDVRVQRLKEDVRANSERRRAILGRLNAIRSRPAGTPIVPQDPLDPAPPRELATIVSIACARNPELDRLRQLERVALAGIRVADLNRYTDPTVGLEYVVVGEGPLTQFPDNGRDAVGISVSVPIPFAQRGREAERCAAHMERAAARKQIAAYEDRLRGDLATALHGYLEAVSRESTYRDQILPLVEREIEVGLQEYSTGRGTMTDLLKYESERLRVHQDIRRARTRHWKERARIDQAAGARVGSMAQTAPSTQPGSESKE